jgi:hypothetical protein
VVNERRKLRVAVLCSTDPLFGRVRVPAHRER